MLRIAVLLLAIGLLVSCGESPAKIEQRDFALRNSTSHVFAKPLDVLRSDVLATLDDFNVMLPFYQSFAPEGGYTFSVSTRDVYSPTSRDIFTDAANANDIYLEAFGALIGPSPLYYTSDKPLVYTAEFQVHFEKVDENSTKVSVITHHPKVVNGSECCSAHGLYSIYQDVEPTSIEEYRILQLIGQVAGTRDMPPIKLPVGGK